MNTKGKQTTRVTMLGAFKGFAAVTLLALAIGGLNPAAAQDQSGHEQGHEMKAPQTAQEHNERAAQYRKTADEQRQAAQAHRKMLADYSKTVSKNPKDTGENAYVKKMRLHCENYIKAAEALAQEADEMAKYHTMRAKEMEGK